MSSSSAFMGWPPHPATPPIHVHIRHGPNPWLPICPDPPSRYHKCIIGHLTPLSAWGQINSIYYNFIMSRVGLN